MTIPELLTNEEFKALKNVKEVTSFCDNIFVNPENGSLTTDEPSVLISETQLRRIVFGESVDFEERKNALIKKISNTYNMEILEKVLKEATKEITIDDFVAKLKYK